MCYRRIRRLSFNSTIPVADAIFVGAKWTRHLGTGAIALLSVVAVGAAALFSSADQAGRVAADSQRLKAVQIAVADTATHRAALVIAFATNQAETDVGRQAIDEAVAAAVRIEAQVIPLADADQLQSLAQTLTESTRSVQSSLGKDGAEVARVEVERSTLPAVGALAQALSSEAAAIGGRIDAEQARAGQIAQAASFVVALIVPILAVVMVRARAKRRLERTQLESEVERQKDLAETRDRLIAGMSHQLRTPLTAIYGWADLISNQPSPEVAEEGSMAILEQAGELRRMVDDILVSARLDATNLSNRPTPTPIDRIVEGAIRHFRRIGAEIKVDCEPTVVNVDAARLQHALHNLVSNSLLHGDGTVELIGKSDGVQIPAGGVRFRPRAPGRTPR